MNQPYYDNELLPTNEEIEQAKAIPLGITREELIARLGDPTDTSIGTRKYPTPGIYKYRAIEFSFLPYKAGVLYLIGYSDKDFEFITLKSEQ